MEPSITNTKIFSVKLKGKWSDIYAFRRKLKKGKKIAYWRYLTLLFFILESMISPKIFLHLNAKAVALFKIIFSTII